MKNKKQTWLPIEDFVEEVRVFPKNGPPRIMQKSENTELQNLIDRGFWIEGVGKLMVKATLMDMYTIEASYDLPRVVGINPGKNEVLIYFGMEVTKSKS